MWWLTFLACSGSPTPTTPSAGSTGTVPSTPTSDSSSSTILPDPCDPDPAVFVTEAVVSRPWGPHEAQLDVTLSAEASVAVRCTLDADPAEQHLVEDLTAQVSHTLRIAGLLAEASYTCQVAPTCPTASTAPASIPLVTPASADAGLPRVVVEATSTDAGRDYVVTDLERVPNDGSRPLVFDRDGNIRWAARLTRAAATGVVPGSAALHVTGTWPPHADNRTRVLDVFGGAVVYDVATDLPDAAESLFHHDGRVLADGRLLTLEERPHLNDRKQTVRAFAVRIVDPASGTVDFDYHAERAYLEGHLPGRQGNSYHPNWVNQYRIDGTDVVHVSLCGPSLTVAIDVPTGDWRWAFGAGGDFALVDSEGKALPDDAFPQCQHGLQRSGSRLLVYDNGKERGRSRAVEYELDESSMTATRLWTWSREGWHENNLGGVAWTSEGNVLIAMGHRDEISPTPGAFTRFVEIDPASGSVLWEARYGEINEQAFRAESLDPCTLFANARYCAATASRIEQLAPAFSPTR